MVCCSHRMVRPPCWFCPCSAAQRSEAADDEGQGHQASSQLPEVPSPTSAGTGKCRLQSRRRPPPVMVQQPKSVRFGIEAFGDFAPDHRQAEAALKDDSSNTHFKFQDQDLDDVQVIRQEGVYPSLRKRVPDAASNSSGQSPTYTSPESTLAKAGPGMAAGPASATALKVDAKGVTTTSDLENHYSTILSPYSVGGDLPDTVADQVPPHKQAGVPTGDPGAQPVAGTAPLGRREQRADSPLCNQYMVPDARPRLRGPKSSLPHLPPNSGQLSKGRRGPEEDLPGGHLDQDHVRDGDEEVLCLQRMVQKLSAELSKYHQAKLALEEPGPSTRHLTSPWLSDLRQMMPLQVAFEEEIHEKNEMLKDYQNEMNELKTRTLEVVEQNEALLKKLERTEAVSEVNPERHLLLAQNAQLVIDENELLKSRLDNLKKQLQHQQDASEATLKMELDSREVRLKDSTSMAESIRRENGALKMDIAKLSEELQRNVMDNKDLEARIARLQEQLKLAKESADDDRRDTKNLVKDLNSNLDRLSRKLVKVEMEATRLRCENKVCRKMVLRYDQLAAGLRKQVASGLEERNQLRMALDPEEPARLENRKPRVESTRRPPSMGHGPPPQRLKVVNNNLEPPRQKEIQLLMKIHQKLVDLKTETALADNPTEAEPRATNLGSEKLTLNSSSD